MFNRYYQDELTYLRDMAKEFAGLHPALAPMLSGPTSDPDVERLLEGVAFSTAMLRQKLDDEFPEIIHGLMDIIFPHYLRPIPSASIVAFFSKAGFSESVEIPHGTGLESVPVDGTACGFKTCYDVTVEPLVLTRARLVEEPGRAAHIRLSLEVSGGDLDSWRANRLRFLLGAGVADATNLYLLMNRHLARIILRPRQGGREYVLPPESLIPAGFGDNEQLIPYPRRTFSGYRLLQEYFILPRKFLYMDLEGLGGWQDRGTDNRFDIIFEFADPPFQPPRVHQDDFVLFATPVINIFPYSAEPVELDHRQAAVPVRPSGGKPRHYQVFSVDEVVGVVHGSARKKTYLPFDRFEQGEDEKPVYQIVRRPSLNNNSAEFSLTFPYPDSAGTPIRETLSLTLSCTNGSLSESLQLGDISRPTYNTPIGVTFKNIIPPTMPIAPNIDKDTLWRFLSHLSLNLLSIASTESLKELLHLYIYPEGRDRAKIAANEKRISGILAVESRPTQRVIGGHLMRGWQVHLEMRQDRFAGPGDMYLFCNILDAFFGMYAGLNSFTRLSVRDTMTGEEYLWPPRIGERHLL
jgi:type VI secretion system protein ImpG